MKITENEIRQIINEEIEGLIQEGWLDRAFAKAGSTQFRKSLAQRLKPGAGTHVGYTSKRKKAAKLLKIFGKRLGDTPAITGRMSWYLGDFIKDVEKLDLLDLPLPPNKHGFKTMADLHAEYKSTKEELDGINNFFGQLAVVAADLSAAEDVIPAITKGKDPADLSKRKIGPDKEADVDVEIEDDDEEEGMYRTVPARKEPNPEFWQGGIKEMILREIEAALKNKLSED